MKVAFFHGLDSEPITEKNYALRERFDDVYDPAMDYKNPQMFETVLKHLQENPVDLLIGSSMGGYFAYCLSTNLGTRTLLFNPAVHSRPIEPVVSLGGLESNHLIVLGNSDNIITPKETEEFFMNVSGVNIIREDIGHTIPIEIFKKYIRLY
jgi:esterase/lipase